VADTVNKNKKKPLLNNTVHKKLKVLMILSNPFITDNRVRKEAKSLVDEGHEVTVIVWDRRNEYLPEEEVGGVHLIRVHNSYFMKLLSHDL